MPPDLEALKRGDALVEEDSRVRVKVLLYDPADLGERSMAERRVFLEEEFGSLRKNRSLKPVEIEMDHLSVAGQCVSAMIPLDRWSKVVSILLERGLKVIPRMKFKAFR